MRRVDGPHDRARRRRQAKALDRRQARRSGPVVTRYVPTYGVLVLALDAAEWNVHPRRELLAEVECRADRFVVVAETFPTDERVPDDGVVVVAHVEQGAELCHVFAELTAQLADLMAEKFGPLGWLPDRGVAEVFDART
jgi:hypothetical protein